ncbi:MAG: RnfABCDGE type electron transport complex subunit G [Magnetococcales bacterium]|nr:RnfABCDGE type electron transport complex subunit G [Magnetococcales bacterium]
MIKNMPDYVKMGWVLMVTGMVATALLSGTDQLTSERIADAKRQETLAMLTQVLPPGFDNQPDQDIVTLSDPRLNRKGTPVTFYRAARGDSYLGAAFIVTAPDGYAGEIGIMMAVRSDGRLQSVQVVAHKETPGLGDKIVDSVWLSRFAGQSLTSSRWSVKKDGGDFDQFAGATISPRAVVNAVKRGLGFFVENQQKVLARRGS